MEFSEVVRRRRMVRHYTSQPLTDEVVERILHSAVRAPSAGFSQGWSFLVLTEPADRDRFWPFVPTRVEQTPTMQDAPLVVVPLAHKDAYLQRYAEPDKGWEDRAEARWPAPYWYIDTGMAALLMLLTAVDEGLGACFFGIMPEHLSRSGTSSGSRPRTRRSAESRSATAPPTCRRKLIGSRNGGAACRTSCTAAIGAAAARSLPSAGGLSAGS